MGLPVIRVTSQGLHSAPVPPHPSLDRLLVSRKPKMSTPPSIRSNKAIFRTETLSGGLANIDSLFGRVFDKVKSEKPGPRLDQIRLLVTKLERGLDSITDLDQLELCQR
jgi:hypothetical protein